MGAGDGDLVLGIGFDRRRDVERSGFAVAIELIGLFAFGVDPGQMLSIEESLRRAIGGADPRIYHLARGHGWYLHLIAVIHRAVIIVQAQCEPGVDTWVGGLPLFVVEPGFAPA